MNLETTNTTEDICPNCGGELYPEENGSVSDYECGDCDEKFTFDVGRMMFINNKNLH
jgi:tRNA(Ile2) C34 agmatinyltransferase TiaS